MLSKLKIILLGIIILHSIILTKLIYFPYPELFIYPYLTNHGLKPYQQILDQHFPGLLFLPVNFDNLGLNNEHTARWWSIVSIILIHLLLFFISEKILKSKYKALLVNFLYLIWQPFFEGWVLWIDSFLPLLLLPAFYALYKNKLFLCGLFLGIGIVFKQTLIPLVFLVFLYIFWQSRKMEMTTFFLCGVLVPVLLMVIYLVYLGVLKDFWYWTIIFNLTTYAKFGTSTPATWSFITRVVLVYCTSIFAFTNKDKKLIQILFIFLFGALVGVFDRANFIHFQPSLPFPILATTLGVYQLNKNKFFKVFMLIYIIIATWWLNIFYKGHISDKIFFFDEQTKLIANKIKKYTNHYDKIFVFGASPHLYQMADRLPAGNIFVFQFPWFLKISKDRILQGIKNDKPVIVISDRTIEIEGQKISNFASDIDQYIQENYHAIDYVGTTTIMHR